MRQLKDVFSKLKPEPVFLSLLYRIFGVYIIFTFCRILFLLFNASYFHVNDFKTVITWFWGGIIFDTAAILYTNILLVVFGTLPLQIRYKKWYQSVLTGIFIFANSIAIMANIADVFYFPFTLTRTTISVFEQFKHESNLGILFGKFLLDYWYGVLIFAGLIWLLVQLAKKTKPAGLPGNKTVFYYAYGLILMLLSYTLFVGGVRGGYKHSTRPITLSNAGQYIKEPNEVNIVLNTPFCIMKTSDVKSFPKVDYMSQELADSLFPVIYHPPSDQDLNKKNVVIIVLESFGREFISFFNRDYDPDYTGYAPFLDSLCEQSLTFKYSLANARKSIDLMPSVLVSIPSMVEPYITTQYYNNKVQSLPYLLGEEGYHTSFVHGAPNGSMGYLAFSKLIGIDEYIGMDEYGNKDDFDGYWAIWDEPFMQFYAGKLNEFPEPFFSTFFSASSHHPFNVPEEYAGVFPEGPHPIDKCIGYTDHALKEFFQKISKEAWFENTLFVITADHCQAEPQIDLYRTPLGLFEVPIILYTPDGSLKGKSDNMIQQIDIMPVILGQLNYNKPYFAYGSDVLKSGNTKCTVGHLTGTYVCSQNGYTLLYNNEKTIGLYNFEEDRLFKNNLAGKTDSVQSLLELNTRAFLQQYFNRVIDNNTSVESNKF